jgi:hypothetical protein
MDMMVTLLELKPSLSIQNLHLTETAIDLWVLEVAFRRLKRLFKLSGKELMHWLGLLLLLELQEYVVILRTQLSILQLSHYPLIV